MKKYVCPKCRSENIKVTATNSGNKPMSPNTYICKDCGYCGTFLIKEG